MTEDSENVMMRDAGTGCDGDDCVVVDMGSVGVGGGAGVAGTGGGSGDGDGYAKDGW